MEEFICYRLLFRFINSYFYPPGYAQRSGSYFDGVYHALYEIVHVEKFRLSRGKFTCARTIISRQQPNRITQPHDGKN